jgi:hypothetical protein
MITIKFNENDEHEELIKFLKEGEGDFEMPKYFAIPKGERSTSQRARILMLAGIEALREKYPKNIKNLQIKRNEIDSDKEEIKNTKEIDLPKSWT